MDPVTIGLWINLITAGVELGTKAYNSVRLIMKESGLTDDQINLIEAASNADSAARLARRKLMLQP
jgi:hypothetical protein